MTDYIFLGLNLMMLCANAYMAHLLVKQSTINITIARMLCNEIDRTKP